MTAGPGKEDLINFKSRMSASVEDQQHSDYNLLQSFVGQIMFQTSLSYFIHNLILITPSYYYYTHYLGIIMVQK